MGILTGILNSLLILTSLFLICLVLIQRGKGGGLAGAFGGMGGSSAFGTKAGDVFTKVTMCVAGFWIVLSMLLVIISNRGGESAWGNDTGTGTRVTREAPAAPGTKTAKDASAAPAGGGATAPASSAPVSAPALPEPAKSK